MKLFSKKFVCSLLVFIFSLHSHFLFASTRYNTLDVSSHAAIIFERKSGHILYEKNAYEKLPMASTTKIMTCLLIIENCKLDDSVTISDNSAKVIGSRLGLNSGDIISVKDLLYGMMLSSGNDAAIALAEYCSGSVENFAELMNAKATTLNLYSTHFVSPHGLDNNEHYTTVYDFSILTNYALNNPLFLQIVGTKYYTVTINGHQKEIHNTNDLLSNSVYGVKTGYTSNAREMFNYCRFQFRFRYYCYCFWS